MECWFRNWLYRRINHIRILDILQHINNFAKTRSIHILGNDDIEWEMMNENVQWWRKSFELIVT